MNIVARREPESTLWNFYLVNDGAATIECAELEAVKYEFGDQYLGGESPGTTISDLAPGAEALIWQDDGGSEMRTDLWLRITIGGAQRRLLFEFPKLYRQRAITLVARCVEC